MNRPPVEPDDDPEPTADTLGMSPEEMRRLGHRVVDMVVDRLQQRDREPALLSATREALWTRLGGPLPDRPLDPDTSLALLADVALAHQQHGDHPRYFARIPGPGSFAALLADWLATGYNTITSSWNGGSGPATLELVVIDWLRQLLGMPAETEGVLVSGGSIANLTAFVLARSQRGDGIVYMSDQAHASLLRNLRALGYGADSIRILESDDAFRLPVETLAGAVAEDRNNGLQPVLVITSAGTTNTGAVDPLADIAALCRQENLWFHVDGAYGAPAALSDHGREILQGIDAADSLVLDPHKWLFQPYDAGCLLVRHGGALEACFSMNPEYLKDVQSDTGEVDFRNRGLELSRRSRAAKLWMCFRTYGTDRIRQAIEHGIELAEIAQRYLEQEESTWEVVTPAQLGIICFALRNAAPGEHQRRADAVTKSGYACVTCTRLRGRDVLRLCTINPLTTSQDIVNTIDMLAACTD